MARGTIRGTVSRDFDASRSLYPGSLSLPNLLGNASCSHLKNSYRFLTPGISFDFSFSIASAEDNLLHHAISLFQIEKNY